MLTDLAYLAGFGSYLESEALEGALPVRQNSPQRTSYGLYAEQLSGTAFTRPRKHNFFTWFYRIQPSVKQSAFETLPHDTFLTPPFNQEPSPPTQLRWDPLPDPRQSQDFIDSLFTMVGHGGPASHSGAAIHLYACDRSMEKRYFYNADGEMLIVPQQGSLHIKTECGDLHVEPLEIVIIPRGMKCQINPTAGLAKGYMCENFGAMFTLPDLGPIGANGLANPRHFLAPVACYEETKGPLTLVAKYQGHLWQAAIEHSPLDVVAWHGNYVPFKYDLRLFNVMNTVSFDHPDPSIFTVLTSPTDTQGVANIDFVIFPPRWMVAENTFRPPYYHRNIMSEYMGLIQGEYDAKPGGFLPGGSSLHNCMSAHGPDNEAFSQAIESDLQPERYKETMAFMFESLFAWLPSPQALTSDTLQKDYLDCWQSLTSHFDPALKINN